MAIGPLFGDQASNGPDASVQYQANTFKYSRCGSVADAQATELRSRDLRASHGGARDARVRAQRLGRPVTANHYTFLHKADPSVISAEDAAVEGTNRDIQDADDKPMAMSK